MIHIGMFLLVVFIWAMIYIIGFGLDYYEDEFKEHKNNALITIAAIEFVYWTVKIFIIPEIFTV